jgi:uncharacterized protein (TIGR02145 family)/uncharacterized repeat protein (TIGR02543 family)
MLKNLISLISAIFLVCSVFLITCGPLPTNPADDPSNVTATFFLKSNNTALIQDNEVEFGLIIGYPNLTQKIRLSFDNNPQEDTLFCKSRDAVSAETLYFEHTYKDTGTKTIVANVNLTNNTIKQVPYTLSIMQKPITILFDTIPVAPAVPVDSFTALRFVVHTEPAAKISYDVNSVPSLDSSRLKIEPFQSGAIVYIKPAKAGLHKLSFFTESGLTLDTAFVTVLAYNKPVLSELHKKSDTINFIPGKTDTFLFVVKADTLDTVKLKLIDTNIFKTGVVTVLPTNPDSLKIAFAPDEEKTYTFSIVVSGKYSTDTVKIQKTVKIQVTDSTGPVITLQTPSKDSSKVSTSLVTVEVKCTDPSGISSVAGLLGSTAVTVSKGVGSIYSAVVSGLAVGVNTLTFTATDSSTSLNKTTKTYTIYYDPTMTDSTGPVITLQTPSKDSSKVSSSLVTVEVKCTDPSGVSSVTGLLGSAPVTVSKGLGSIYSAVVNGLAAGANTLTFTAIDSSTNLNKTTKTFTIYYDPTMIDNVAPVISLKNPKINGERIESDTMTIQVICKDENGVTSVTAVRANIPVNVTNSSDSIYSVKLTALTAGKSDTVIFTATDKSANANIKVFSVVVTYDRKLSNIVLSLPENNATGAALKPTFSWSGGDDPDGTAVTYTLKYGTSITNLSQSISGLTTASAALTSSLTANTPYYWQIISKSTVNTDTTASEVWTFTTVEAAPIISTDPSDTSVLVGNKAKFSVMATGFNPKYQWQKGEVTIPDATSSSYTTPVTTSADDATTYRCIVSNNGGSDTSAVAKLTIQYSVTYNGNGNTSGTVPVDVNTYSKNETVVTKANTDLAKGEYVLIGWNTAADGSGATYAPGTGSFIMGSANVVLYAKWPLFHTVLFSDQEATTPVNPSTIKVLDSTVIGTLPTSPEKTGYVFAGWQTFNNDPITANTIVTSDMTVYAKWEIRDADNNLYHEVKIGDQVWMVENLKTTKLRDGTAAGFKFPNDSESNKNTYGLLYGSADNNLAPSGWKIPSKEDFDTLITYLKTNGYGYNGVDTAIAKSLAATNSWQPCDTLGTPGNTLSDNNKTGFSALPAGFYNESSGFQSFGTICLFNTTSQYSQRIDNHTINYQYDYSLGNSGSSFGSGSYAFGNGIPGIYMSIRLIRE